MRTIFIKIIVACFLFSIVKPIFSSTDYWQQSVHYNFNVRLDVENHALSGDGLITYKNNSPDTLNRIYLHLYPNAFKNENSTMAQEAKKLNYRRRITSRNNGYIDILEFRISLPDSNAAPEDAPVVAYFVDDTILESNLPEPLLPGEELQFYIKFYEKIPATINRGGWRGNQYDITQWYPKLVVYDEKGWHPDQYHLNGEFYGEFAVFDVNITLPYNYIVGATGVPVEGDPGWSWVEVDTSLSDEEWQKKRDEQLEEIKKYGVPSKERTVKFHAQNVHDFAWLACPDFLYERGEWHSIPVHVLYRSYARKDWSKKVVQRGEKVLQWLSTRFGMYPYPQLSITHGLLGGGMEYPMLVMNSGPWEGLISHEVGHIYFYGILASDELAESWMDEGFTSYQEDWYRETNYGVWDYEEEAPDKNSWSYKLNPRQPSRQRSASYLVDYLTSGYNEPAAQYAQDFKGGYYMNAYSKGAYFFGMLHNMVGDSVWDEICHTYFDRWKFKHVNEARFNQVCEDVTGEDLDWYFDQWLHETVAVDYALGKVKKSKQADGSWKTEVEIKRKDKGIMPVEVQLTLNDDEKIIQKWNGKEKKGSVVFVTENKPQKVVIDPDDNILDKNRLNNGVMGIQFLPDNPFAYGYLPRNLYVIKYAPKIWYNDVDGLWIGAGFNGSYMGKFKKIGLGLTYGIKSQKPGAYLSYKQPLKSSSDKWQLKLSAVAREGRTIGELALNYETNRMRYYTPSQQFQIVFSTAQLLKSGVEYARRNIVIDEETVSVAEWQRGRVNKISLDYILELEKNLVRTNFNLNLETSNDVFGSEYNYSKIQGNLGLRLGGRNDYVATRFFAGSFFGDNSPLQERFFIDGANPRTRFEKFYLRSMGALPARFCYQLPGGANLRGYLNQPLPTERILASNNEFSLGFLAGLFRKMLPRRASLGLSAFFDAGKILTAEEKYKNLMDAGLGLRFSHRYLRFRFDFPFWVSEPLSGEKEFKFRWLFSFQNVM